MGNARLGRQYSVPIFVSSLDRSPTALSLEPISVVRGSASDQSHDERWVQELIFRFPQALPIHELEPGIGRIVPIAMEVPTPAGYIDNVFVTPQGNIVLAECKLWRNPQARREVLAQVIDYARGISTWRYDEFEAAVTKGVDDKGGRLACGLFDYVRQTVGDDTELDEASFVDAVQRNLRLGRLLLLVVGDGIREGAESLIDYLQVHAGFHFTLGMVELSVFKLPDRGYIVQPRLLVRTLNIERGIVKLASDAIVVDAVRPIEGSPRTPVSTISSEVFYEALSRHDANVPQLLKGFLGKAADLGVFLDPATKSASLKWEAPSGDVFNLGGITLDAKLITYAVNWVPNGIGRLDLSHAYLERLGMLVGGTVRQTPNPANWYITKGGTALPDAIGALHAADSWLEIIQDYVSKLSGAE